MKPRWLGLAVFLLVGCDNRQAFHTPDPTLARMLEQRRADAFGATTAFDNGMVMRTPPHGTVSTDAEDSEEAPPPPITRALLDLGRKRFETTCATCHGIAGDGRSAIAAKMELRKPPSLFAQRHTRARLYTVATHGYGLMPSYKEFLDREERWAVASYILALKLSQSAKASDLPPDVQRTLAEETR
ncbi:ABC-type Fe3+ transport system protein [Labilithrix luteola]|uniref:ABC-type Fe3+ transport system protein n=1 Tax=Labilithrix luteola TaxID=1391654 RepID=A0A0K1PVF4_9BACT|nr:cytochrome c [Labilithrix luteola]AKU97513.1 ABC-type Fe3+ transport system protein [Labilithrix luteola]